MNDELRPAERPGLEKDPEEWVTGDEPMTGAQASYLETLSRQTGEQVEGDLSKAEASKKIDELREKAGLGEGDRPR
ncbi:MAG: DUF3072 domain-containing protein [Chloroflexota bacterium]|nr:DUF3072 domain-containing protein [Chloroflexota bacterium]